MNNILSLDCSTKRTGWAYYENENSKVQYGVIASSSTDVEKRITVMREGLIDLLKRFDVKTIVIEEVRPDGYNNHTGKVLTWLQGIIVIATYEYDKNINIEFIGASSWRSILGIQGYRVQREQQKKKDILYANEKYGLNLVGTQDDEADALCLLAAYLATGPESKNKNQKEESAF